MISLVQRLFALWGEERKSTPHHEEAHQDYQTHQEPPFEEQKQHSHTAEPPPGRKDKVAEAYSVLELPYGADMEEVGKARKRLLRKFHPDRFGKNAEKQAIAHEVTQSINSAYEVLKNHLG